MLRKRDHVRGQARKANFSAQAEPRRVFWELPTGCYFAENPTVARLRPRLSMQSTWGALHWFWQVIRVIDAGPTRVYIRILPGPGFWTGKEDNGMTFVITLTVVTALACTVKIVLADETSAQEDARRLCGKQCGRSNSPKLSPVGLHGDALGRPSIDAEGLQVFLLRFRPALRAVNDVSDFDRLGKHPINHDERQRRQR
jgi:hypothetical protein